MKLSSTAAIVVLVSSLFMSPLFMASAEARDDDRIAHYKGEPSPTLEAAVKNLTEFNQKLEAILASDDLDIRKLAEIHQLTYTLENALERLDDELEAIAETLEEVHVGSETGKYDQVRKAGQEYLEHIRKLLPTTDVR